MTGGPLPDVAGFEFPARSSTDRDPAHSPGQDACRPTGRPGDVEDRLASWLSDMATLQELNDGLVKAGSLDTALHEILQAGAALVGARRGVAVLEPADGKGPAISVGLGLERSDLGTLETVPHAADRYGRVLGAEIGSSGGVPGALGQETGGGNCGPELVHPDIAGDAHLPERHREVAARLGIAASYTRLLATPATGALGTVVWMYDEPAEPSERQRHLAGLYCAFASELIAKQLRLARSERDAAALRSELLPARLPQVPGVRLGARLRTGPEGGGDWYDALALPEGALGLSVGGVTGTGPAATAAMARLRAALRAYMVLEGEDPVAVLSDLETLLRLAEPARAAAAIYAHVDPGLRRIALAGAGHCPPLLFGARRLEFVETSLSAPLGMLSCWEAPGVEVTVEPGETLVLYTDGLLHRGGGTLDQAFVRLHTAAALAPPEAHEDPEALCEHLLLTCLPDDDGPQRSGADLPAPGGQEDVAVLAVRFD